MKRLVAPAAPVALLALLVLSPARAEEPTVKTSAAKSPELIETLSEEDLAQFLPLLRENYIDPKKLTDTEVSRATLKGLLERLGPGASIRPTNSNAAPAASPFRSELLEDRIGYIRLGSLNSANLVELDNTLQSYAGHPIAAVVLDLRATPAGGEFEEAANFCRRFCPKGKVLFTLKKPSTGDEQMLTSKDEPGWRGLLIVLVDSDTAGAAEVIAAVLRQQTRAMVMGQTTKGEGAEFTELSLPSGKALLRVAVGEVALPENVSIFPGGVKPDLEVSVPQETTDAVLKSELERGVKELVSETERPRMNEAALVAGTNPELEAYQAGKREKIKAPLRDALLQRAIDFVTAINIYERRGAK